MTERWKSRISFYRMFFSGWFSCMCGCVIVKQTTLSFIDIIVSWSWFPIFLIWNAFPWRWKWYRQGDLIRVCVCDTAGNRLGNFWTSAQVHQYPPVNNKPNNPSVVFLSGIQFVFLLFSTTGALVVAKVLGVWPLHPINSYTHPSIPSRS